MSWIIDRYEAERKFDHLKDVPQDEAGSELYQVACEAIYQARKDGQRSGKHSPESWQEESIENQIEHASEHLEQMYALQRFPDSVPSFHSFMIEDAKHALCRLAIALALYERQQNGR